MERIESRRARRRQLGFRIRRLDRPSTLTECTGNISVYGLLATTDLDLGQPGQHLRLVLTGKLGHHEIEITARVVRVVTEENDGQTLRRATAFEFDDPTLPALVDFVTVLAPDDDRRGEVMATYGRPAEYDAAHGEDHEDLPFFEQLASRAGGPILDLGCGTGREAIYLARKGYEVVGVDLVQPMIELARDKARAAGVEVEWVAADYCDMDLGRRFPLVITPFNQLPHMLGFDVMDRFLSSVERHITDDGLFQVDRIHSPPAHLAEDRFAPFELKQVVDAETGDKTTLIMEPKRYDQLNQVLHFTLSTQPVDGGSPTVDSHRWRVYFPSERLAHLHYHGLTVEEIYGDWQRYPFTDHSSMMIVVARRRSANSAST